MSMRVPSLVLIISILFGCVNNQPYTGSDQSARELLIGKWNLEGEATTVTFNSGGSGLIEAYIESGHVTLDSELSWSISGNKLITVPSLESPDKRTREVYILREPKGSSIEIKSINGRRVLTLTAKNI